MGILEKILLGIECFCRKLYSKIWYYRITLTTNLPKRTRKLRIKK